MKFSFKIASTHASTKTVVLIPGSYRVMDFNITLTEGTPNTESHSVHYHDVTEVNYGGHNADFVLDDGQIDDTDSKMLCTALNSEFKIRHFLNHIKTTPYICNQIAVQADNVDVFSEKFTYQRDMPTGGTRKEYIELQDYFNPGQFQDNKIIINDRPIVLSDQTILLFSIPAGRTVQIHFNKLSTIRK